MTILLTKDLIAVAIIVLVIAIAAMKREEPADRLALTPVDHSA